MITLILYSGVEITPMIRFMVAAFDLITAGAVVLRVVEVARSAKWVDVAAQRRERWEAAHAEEDLEEPESA